MYSLCTRRTERQTDGRTKATLIDPFSTGLGHNNACETPGDTPLAAASSCVTDAFVESKTLAVGCIAESLRRDRKHAQRGLPGVLTGFGVRYAGCLYAT